MKAVLNISAYKFHLLADAAELRATLYERALALGLKGTVLLAEEGINLFLAGSPEGVRGWVHQLQQDERFADLAPKESFSDTVPFKRLLVKVKREIIRMNRPAVRPAAGRAPALPAPTLARWLEQGHDDTGRPVVMLDTRNGFEVDAGAFEDAIDWRLTKFSEFPDALQANLAALQGKTVVSYCTGGIRCEKAALLMQEAGLANVWQLEGGILKYFEETHAPRWRGACFVFDERVGLAADLQPAEPATA
ncbi:sulfurtransferase [Azohydromonas lata]|uniref:sulfurtransferase n=1 Tax=Azohydromonas lata TaxID=45677 RepID=UPI000833FD4A|nr:sulfurtransferase [Azohydromonas lata]